MSIMSREKHDMRSMSGKKHDMSIMSREKRDMNIMRRISSFIYLMNYKLLNFEYYYLLT